jgi:hypothetical protein
MMMSGPKFAIGQSVDFERTPSASTAKGPYEVIRVLPADGADTRVYRIKSKVEPFERAANEYDLVAVTSPPGERPEAARQAGGRKRWQ